MSGPGIHLPPGDPRAKVVDMLRAPAFFLLCSGVLNVIFNLVGFVLAALKVTSPLAQPGTAGTLDLSVGLVLMLLVGILCGVLSAWGALSALNLRGYGLATVKWHDDQPGDPTALGFAMRRALATFDRYVETVTAVTGRDFQGVRMSDDPVVASWDLAARLPLHTWERQRLLERDTAAERFADLAYIVRREQRLLAVSGVLGVALNHPGHTFTLN